MKRRYSKNLLIVLIIVVLMMSFSGLQVLGAGAYTNITNGFNEPTGVTVDSDGNLYVLEFQGSRIQKFNNAFEYQNVWNGKDDSNYTSGYSNPYSVISDGTYLYVADTFNGYVVKCDKNGNYIEKYGDGSWFPYGIAKDATGNLYVADGVNGQILKLDSLGTTSFTVTNGFVSPYGIAVDSTGSVLFVADATNNCIYKVNPLNGSILATWASPGTGDGQVKSPRGIALDSSGNLYIADCENNRVQMFNSTGTFIKKWGTTGNGDGQFNGPSGVALDNNGNLYIADTGNNRVVVIDLAPPKISSLSPADNAVNIGTNDNLVITFDQNVQIGTGNITIYKSADNSVVEAIDVTSGKVTENGTNTITINPATTLDENTTYYVKIDSSAFDDTVGNSYLGISDNTSWNFTTADLTPPTLVSTARTDNTHITVSLSENCTNIAKLNDGGFTVSEAGNPSKTYTVSSIAQGTDASHVVLTVADTGISAKEGVTVKYTTGVNGTVQDTSGNVLATNGTGVSAAAWDTTAPTIASGTLATSNTYIDVVFNEGVYGANDGTTALTSARLALTFTKNGGTATNAVISSVKRNDNTAEGSASALTGGETTVRAFLTITGTPKGLETIEIKPANGTSIYDKAGNEVGTVQTTGVKTLNDLTPPIFVSAARTDNTHITVTLSENCTNIAKSDNGGFTVSETGNSAITYAVTGIAQGTDASHVVLTVADMGISAKEGVTVKYTAGGNGTVQDTSGNAMAADATAVAAWDTTAPTVSLTHNHADTIVKSGDTVILTATFNENMTSAPTISISNTAVAGTAMTNGSGDLRTWTYSWTVPAEDENADVTVAGTDIAGNVYAGTNKISFTMDNTKPSGYSVYIDQTAINNGNKGAMSFTFSGAEMGATYNYTVSSSGGGSVTGSGTITSATQQVTGINVGVLGDGTLTLSVTLIDIASNTGSATTDTVAKDATIPTGYSVNIDQTGINNGNKGAMSFTFSGAEVGDTYNYTITSSGGGSVSGSGTVNSANHQVTGINVGVLGDGTLTLSVTLTDVAGNSGSAITDTVTKDTTVPTGYSVNIDQTGINNGNKGAMSFTFSGAEVGAVYNYSITSSVGGSVSGSGTVNSANHQVTGINVGVLGDGTLTLNVILTDTAGNAGDAVTKTADKDVIAPSSITISGQNSIPGSGSLLLTASGGPLSNDSWAAILYQIKANTGTGLNWITGIVAGDITITPAADGVTATLNNGNASAAAIRADFVITAANVVDRTGNTAAGNVMMDSYLSEARVTGVSASTANGSYKAGSTIAITVTFDTSVDVIGTPVLHLETGATDRDAVYTGGTGTTTLTFNYTVQAVDTSADLEYKDVSSLVLSGGTIRNTGKTIDAILTLPVPGAASSLGNTKAIVIDTTAPAVVLSDNDADHRVKQGDQYTVTAVFNEDMNSVTVHDNGGHTTVMTNGSGDHRTWTYTWNVPAGDSTVTVSVQGADIAGNAYAGADNLTFTIDNTAPTAVAGTSLEDKDITAGIDGRDFTAGFTDLADESDVVSYKIYIYKDGEEPTDKTAMDSFAAGSKVVVRAITKTAGNDGTATAIGSGMTTDSKGQALAGGDYQVIITAVDAVGNYSFAKTAVKVSVKSDAAPSTPATPSTPAAPTAGDKVIVIINNKEEQAATAVTETVGDKTVTTVTVDDKAVEEKLNSNAEEKNVIIPVNKGADVVVGQLNGQTVKSMETKNAVLEIKTENVTYTLPAAQINIDAVSNQIGKSVELKDIKVKVTVAEPTKETVKVVEDTANRNNYQVVVKPVEFNITCSSGSKTVDVSKFNGYVERTVAMPEGVDPSKITTGIVLNSDGTFSHVPTTIIKTDNKYYAKINSLTNSTYSVIWSPKTFKDVENNWAKDAINDMGSRLIISGIGDDKFGPDLKITRAEFAAIIVRALGLMRPGIGKSSFNDVSKDAWYYDAVSIAYENGIISGCGNSQFRPLDNISREQAMSMIARAMKITGLKINLKDTQLSSLFASLSGSDQSSSWAKESVAACIKAGILIEVNNSAFSPKEKITRAEIAEFVRRLLVKSGLI